MIKLGIVEDKPVLRGVVVEKLNRFNNISIKFSAINGVDLLEKLEINHNIDILLMDLEMPKMNGVVATAEVKGKYPHIKIIIFTVFDNDENIFNAIKAGADGYLLKEVNAEELNRAILETMDGGAVMTPSIALKTLRLFRNPLEINSSEKEELKLSKREIEVLEQLSAGITYVAMAKNLIISEGTIRKHVENIYRKLQVHNKMEAVQKARNHNLI
jgi:DNA-binding NarL/FixJ family response regulator